MSPWVYLTLAIAFEVAGTLLLKLSAGFTNLIWGGLALACYGICFAFMAPALRVLPVGMAYAIWSGVGIVGATALGIMVFSDRLSPLQYGFIGIILVGVIGLRISSTT